MQPTYLPWSGYFNLMASVEDFVFLDDVQFERRSWQSRNRILLNGQEYLLTVPVIKVARETKISDIVVDDSRKWRNHHIKTLTTAYAKTPYGKLILEAILPIINNTQLQRLAELNIEIISTVRKILGITTRLHLASALGCSGNRSEHLANICDRLGTDDYWAPIGSICYLQDDEFSKRYHKHLWVQKFIPAPYIQWKASSFISHLSIIDVLAHLGPEQTRHYIIHES